MFKKTGTPEDGTRRRNQSETKKNKCNKIIQTRTDLSDKVDYFMLLSITLAHIRVYYACDQSDTQ